MKRSSKEYAALVLKGMGMGAADVVPGVSGGTIAFITGIYEELIGSIKSIDHRLIDTLKEQGISGVWQQINGNFLVALFVGIGISIVSLAKGISFLLENHPILLWSFFFGLIIASAYVIAKKVKQWNPAVGIAMIIGIGIAYYVTVATPAETPNASWFVFLSGMIAICAMILPGISGSFILLLMGKYKYILGSISEFKIDVLITFATGCVVGLLTFSHVLNWMFKKYHDATVALLTGFMIGSLNKVWPWKETLSWRTNSHGEQVPLIQENISPLSIDNSMLTGAIVMTVIGLGLVLVLEKFGPKKTTREVLWINRQSTRPFFFSSLFLP